MSTANAAPERAPGLRVAVIGGVPVYIGAGWLVMALLLVAIIGPNVARQRPDLGALAYGVAALYAGLLLVAVLVHEAAHALAARSFGLPVHRVVADLWGGHTAYDPSRATAGSSAVIAVVGPLSNGVLALLAWVFHPLTPAGVPQGLVGAFAFLNAALAAFNLLPGLPLDGGQLVESAVWGATRNRNRGKVVAGWAGRIVAGIVLAWFVLVPVLSGRGFDYSTDIWFVLIGGFLWVGASAAIRQGGVLDRISRVQLGPLLRPIEPVTSETTVARALAGQGIPVVVGPDGFPESLLDGAAVEQVPQAAQAETSVLAVSRPQPSGWVVQADPAGDLLPVVRGLQTARTGVVAVMWQGKVLGVVTAADVNDVLGEN